MDLSRIAEAVREEHIGLINEKAGEIMQLALDLADAWGAVFEISETEFVQFVSALGIGAFMPDLPQRIFKAALSLPNITQTSSSFGSQSFITTWDSVEAIVMVLRSERTLKCANGVDDGKLEELLKKRSDLFGRVMSQMPEYLQRLRIPPDVGSRVLATHGATVSGAGLLALAEKSGSKVTVDMKGRKGIPALFLRSVTGTLAAFMPE